MKQYYALTEEPDYDGSLFCTYIVKDKIKFEIYANLERLGFVGYIDRKKGQIIDFSKLLSKDIKRCISRKKVIEKFIKEHKKDDWEKIDNDSYLEFETERKKEKENSDRMCREQGICASYQPMWWDRPSELFSDMKKELKRINKKLKLFT